MAVCPIRIVGDPVLHTPTELVTEFGGPLHDLVKTMFDTMAAARGVGLAANQIGVNLRLFVYDCGGDCREDCREDGRDDGGDKEGDRRRGVVVNPVLVTSGRPETMPDPDDDWEGCLSVPGESFPTGRAGWAKVTGLDADGLPVTVEGSGLLARCLQHETDHLDGIIYLDRLVGRYAREAKKMLKEQNWGVPGLSWDPAATPPED